MANNVLTKTAGVDGWDAAARSLPGLRGDGSFFFKVVPGSFMVIAGLSRQAVSTDWALLSHAILTSSAEYPVIYELGADKTGAIGGTTSSTTEYEIRRVGTQITYYQNGALLYTSTAPSIGDVWLTATMYREGGGIQDPIVVPGVGGSLFYDTLTVTSESIAGQGVGLFSADPLESLVVVIHGLAVGVASITSAEIVTAVIRGIGVGTTSITATADTAISVSIVGVGKGSIRPVGVGVETWVVNAETGASTRYENYEFNSFAKIGGRYFGCKADGIYQLDGDSDAGDPIRSMVSFGKQNFGTNALKRITNAYVGVSGAGRLFLKVMAEGQEYIYAQRGYDEHLQVQRFDTGRGLRVNWLEFELYNADGEDFELASVEFAIVPTSRRI